MPSKIIIFISLSLILLSMCVAKDIPSMLSEANKLKYAEKYEAAEKIYDEVLKIDPENVEAINGKDDCRVMLTPIIPMQHLAPTEIDPESRKAIKRWEEAKTPWDKKRAEIALELDAVRYTGKVFGEQSEKLSKEVDALIEKAASKIARGLNPERVYLDTERELFDMQQNTNRAWKGHGPEILKPAMERLIKYYDENNLPDPSDPMLLSAGTSPEVTQEGEVSELTVTIKNRSSLPVILIDFQFEGLDYLTFTWQKAMYGELSYDGTKDVFVYNPLAQQETYHHFNLGLLFPGQTTTFRKAARIPQPRPTAYLRFVPVSSHDLKSIYAPTDDDRVYSRADLFELRRNAPVELSLSDENPFPGKGTIIFDTQESIIRMQSFTLDLGPK